MQNMLEKGPKPSLRFEGFTDAWEQRKVSEVANRLDNLRIPVAANLRVSGTTPYYGANGIQDYVEGFTHEGEYVLVAEDGANDLKNYPVKCVNGRIWVNNHAHVLQGKPEIADNKFLAYSISQADIESFLVGGGRAKLNAEVMMGIEFYIPKLNEQRVIGGYLTSLDDLITLNKRKYAKLVNLKKSMLEKMFPKNGVTVPEIRFSGFTDAWEQRKLGECIDRIGTGLNPRDNFKLNTGGSNYYVTIKNFEHGKLYLDDNCDKIDDIALQKIQERSDLRKDDILFTSIGRVGDCYLLDREPKNWNINESVFTLRPNQKVVTPEYLFQTIHSYIVLNQILSNITGSTFKSIKIGELKKAIIPVPCKAEQGKIGTFITALDNLITLHQRKLERLQNIKKSCLEKMFV